MFGRLIFGLLTLTALLSMASACSSTEAGSSSPEPIEVDLNAVTGDSLLLSSIADSVTYLDLELTDLSRVGRVSDVSFTDSAIIVLDRRFSAVYQFDRNGRFEHQVGAHGEGPWEYIFPHSIDTDHEKIYVYDRGRGGTVNCYGYDGRFICRDSIGYYEDVVRVPGREAYLAANFNVGDRSGVYRVTTSPYTIHQLLGRHDNAIDITHAWEFVKAGDKISFMSGDFENSLYEYAGDSLRHILELDVTPTPSASELSHWQRPNIANHYARPSFSDIGREIIAIYSRYTEQRFVVVDKYTGEVKVYRGITNDFDNEKHAGYTPTLIDGCLVWVAGGHDEDANPRLRFLHLKRQ